MIPGIQSYVLPSYFDEQHYQKHFESMLFDAVTLIYVTESPLPNKDVKTAFYRNVAAIRGSILSSGMLLECAANCCLFSLELDKLIYRKLERCSTFDKFEIFLKSVRPDGVFDKCSDCYKNAERLLNNRNWYVHAKVSSAPYEEIGEFELEAEHDDSPLGLSANTMEWSVEDAVEALKIATKFLNTYFIQWCRLDVPTILTLLVSGVKPEVPTTVKAIALDPDKYLDDIMLKHNVSLDFIGKANP